MLDNIFCRSYHSVSDQIQNLQNCYTTPNKNLGGKGPQTDKHLPQSPFTCVFFYIATFDIAFYQSNLSMDKTIVIDLFQCNFWPFLAHGCIDFSPFCKSSLIESNFQFFNAVPLWFV